MGLIRAGLSAVTGTLKDQWKEYFYCDALDNDVLAVRGFKKTNGKNNGNDNIITSGSGIAVNEGQCMIIVEDGKVVEVCAEPGEFTYDSSSEASFFTSSLGEGFKNVLGTIIDRIQYAGETGKDQRVYYFNTKPITDNKFGTPNPIPFRVVDNRINFDVDVSIRCSGTYSFRIFDPVTFYSKVCGNVSGEYTKGEIIEQMKHEFISALTPAMGQLATLGLRPSELPLHNTELEDALNATLNSKWQAERGIEVVNVQLTSVTLPDEDAEMLKKAQQTIMMMNQQFANATLQQATADAMRDAANNSNGAINGFMNLNMAQNTGANNLYAANAAAAAAPAVSWYCPNCGTGCNSNFCSNCGTKKPE